MCAASEREAGAFADPADLRVFTRAVLRDLRALEHVIDTGLIETGVRRIGAEQEMVLVDAACRPAPVAQEVLAELPEKQFTHELGAFNLEVNLDPIDFRGDCLRRLEADLRAAVARVRDAARRHGADVVLTGILPTLRQTDLDVRNMAPVARYRALNEALTRARGSEFELHVRGADEINLKQDSVMLEACNTSAQFHLQVAPDEFAHLYNIAQVVAAPVLAAASNSPLLFGKRLWRETRIAVFEQSIDTRAASPYLQDRSARVSFGNDWVDSSVLEIYREDIARFRVFLHMRVDEDPFEELAGGRVPHLRALQLHNGTVYRWNRACYGVSGGKAHLRIENRVLPSGPTILDEVANAAFWYGLVVALAKRYEDIRRQIDFRAAKENFVRAARHGLDARLTWLDGRRRAAVDLILDELLAEARGGLRDAALDPRDAERYLDVIVERVESGKTGAEWTLRSYEGMRGEGTLYERLRALVAAMNSRRDEDRPVHEWTPAEISEAGDWRGSFDCVGQYMTTDVFTVHEEEVIDLVASVMAWRAIRHVPVEDAEHRLVGLVSSRTLLASIARQMPCEGGGTVAVREIMEPNPVTATPEMSTLEAIRLMREKGVACLPVVKNDRLVGIVSEHDFMVIAEQLLKECQPKP